MNENILYLILQAGSLMQMPRTHKRSLGTTFDTVASHSFHVAIIAYCLARMEKLSHDEAAKCLIMGLFHDLAEARTGDLDFVSKHYSTKNEELAIQDTFQGIDFGLDLVDIIEEYEKRESSIAKCAKDADSVEQMYQEWVLAWQGNKLAEKWFDGDFTHRVPHFFTESAKKLVTSMKGSNPHQWWWSQFVEKGVNYQHLNGSKK